MPQTRKIHFGARGGKYVIVKGKKKYLPSSKKTKKTSIKRAVGTSRVMCFGWGGAAEAFPKI